MTWLNLIIFWLLLGLSQALTAAPQCPANLLDRFVPQAGSKGTAMFPQEIIQREYQSAQQMADNGFDHLVGMINVATIYPCSRGKTASVEIQEFSIVRWDKENQKLVTEATARYDGGKSTYALTGGQWKRQPEWFISGQPLLAPQVAHPTDGVLSIDLALVPENIFHAWTEPRLKAVPGARYGIIAIVRVTGDARLQLGMDYWKGSSSNDNGWSEGCRSSNNCEAWLSDWVGDTKGKFQLVVAPRSLRAP